MSFYASAFLSQAGVLLLKNKRELPKHFAKKAVKVLNPQLRIKRTSGGVARICIKSDKLSTFCILLSAPHRK